MNDVIDGCEIDISDEGYDFRNSLLCFKHNHYKNKQLCDQRKINWHVDTLQTKHIGKTETAFKKITIAQKHYDWLIYEDLAMPTVYQ